MTRRPTASSETQSATPSASRPLLGEWAALGVLYGAPAHGYAIARELAPDGPVGRIWTVRRALTYRSLSQLECRGWIERLQDDTTRAAGPRRVTWVATRVGQNRFREWLGEPVVHQRDLRNEFLLKLTFGGRYEISVEPLIDRQRTILARAAGELERQRADDPNDLVVAWRFEQTIAAQRFCDRISVGPGGTRLGVT